MRVRGITWKEMLLVLAILGVLILIMMPAMYSERGYDRNRVQCSVNLSVVGRVLAVYAAANSDQLPQVRGVSGAGWLCDQPRGTFGLMVDALRRSAGPSGVRDPEKFFFCPKNGDQDMPTMLKGGGGYVVTGYAWFTNRGAKLRRACGNGATCGCSRRLG